MYTISQTLNMAVQAWLVARNDDNMVSMEKQVKPNTRINIIYSYVFTQRLVEFTRN